MEIKYKLCHHLFIGFEVKLSQNQWKSRALLLRLPCNGASGASLDVIKYIPKWPICRRFCNCMQKLQISLVGDENDDF